MGGSFRFRFGFFRAYLTVALSIAAFAASADPPPAAKIRIGDITFNYNPLSWRIVPKGDALVATCVQFDCNGIVVDIDQRPSEHVCDKEFARDKAKQLFPHTDRHAVNVLRTKQFGLVLAESKRGAGYDRPRYFFACIDRQGRDYRFTMRPETVGNKRWGGSALHYLVSRASAPPARVDVLEIGDMALAIPTDVWRVINFDPGRLAWLVCLPPTCHEDTPMVYVSALPAGEAVSQPPSLDFETYLRETRLEAFSGAEPGSVPFTIGTTHSMCRNYVPPMIVATAQVGQTVYRIGSPGGFGCRSSWAVSEEAFQNLLRSARIEAGDPQ